MTAAEKRDAYWAPLKKPWHRWKNEPADGHKHDFHTVEVKGYGGPLCTACLKCGWVYPWGETSLGVDYDDVFAPPITYR